MKKRVLKNEQIGDFAVYLRKNEKSEATIKKYIRDVNAFAAFAKGGPVTKETVLEYKDRLMSRGYAVRSINSMLASVNSFMRFMGWESCRVRSIKVQQQVYCAEEKELTKEDYMRLLEASRSKPRLNLIIQTICSTGIRVSELSFFTVEAVRKGQVAVFCKNKTRSVFIPGKLRKKLLDFAGRRGIREGIIFRTGSGKPIDRSNIWKAMKKLCETAGIVADKVFPHNLRKLFARTFYRLDRDIAKLADILGHGSIDTTRIYIITTGSEHRRKIEKMGLVV